MFSFPAATKMFQFAAFAPLCVVADLQSAGLPHSDVAGSRVICTSPALFAAYRVLLRLREPRHPPVALSYFFFLFVLMPPDYSDFMQFSVYFNLAIKFRFFKMAVSISRLYLLYYLKLFSICQRASLRTILQSFNCSTVFCRGDVCRFERPCSA